MLVFSLPKFRGACSGFTGSLALGFDRLFGLLGFGFFLSEAQVFAMSLHFVGVVLVNGFAGCACVLLNLDKPFLEMRDCRKEWMREKFG